MHAVPRYRCVACCAWLALLLAACSGDGPTGQSAGQSGPPGIRVIRGGGITDTIDAQPLQALVAEVRGKDGRALSGAVVRFEVQPVVDSIRTYPYPVAVCKLTVLGCGFSTLATDTTDGAGRVTALLALGTLATHAIVRISAPALSLSTTATFTITPGAPAGVRAPVADTMLDLGATATLRGRVVDRYDNLRPETPVNATGAGRAITVDAATALVTGRDVGTGWLYLRYGSFVDSTQVRVIPPGRLVALSSSGALRLVNLNGTAVRTIVSNLASDNGVFPHFDATRQRVTLFNGNGFGGLASNAVVIDTTGTPRRDIGPATVFTRIMAVRQVADGTVLVVGERSLSGTFALWRMAADNTPTLVANLPQLQYTFGGADISPDGSRVAWLATVPLYFELRTLNVSTGAITVLATNARSPRWSAQGDRVAYLVPLSGSLAEFGGALKVINADGTGRRSFSITPFLAGIAWSPDGTYIVGTTTVLYPTFVMQLVRLSDDAEVQLRFRGATGALESYLQPDWR